MATDERQGVLIAIEPPTLTPEVLAAIREAKPGKPGRKYGARNKRKRAMEEYLSKFAPEVLETLVARAIAGDHVCLALYMERVYPKPSKIAVQIEAPAVKTPADAREAMASVIQQAMAGELAGDEAADVMEMLKVFLAAHNINTFDALAGGDAIAGEDPRKLFGDRLARIIAAKSAAPAPEGEPAAAPIGFHNPTSEYRSPAASSPAAAPADSIAAIRARMEAARQAPDDADALAGLADDLEALAKRLEATNGHTDSE
jgi:hypothetical protein